ncbi:hypothetical protein ASF60_20410 [Methylobacterium sp. Leaf113]|uniref:hypothetical protein n=1 Tax=Methylobacterium sp. Leaf113 TaxID=1736259 RepID=UPI0006F2F0EC|nr:hypothetical protein ASF60_20410 [Methylobacterium sp. Leaf113]
MTGRHSLAARFVGAALALGASGANAQSILSTGPDCGGDAYSSAQVIENRPPRRGPLTAVPDTLCADVAPQRVQPPVEIGIYPSLGLPGPDGNGGYGRDGRDGSRRYGDPYEGQPPRQRRP